MAVKAVDLLGSPDKWNKDNIKELGSVVAGLLPSELRQMGAQVVKDSLQFLKGIDFDLDQVYVKIKRKSPFFILLSILLMVHSSKVLVEFSVQTCILMYM